MKFLTLIACLFSLYACSIAQPLSDNIDISTSPNGVVALPSTVPVAYTNAGIVKYTKIMAPNGQAIHFLAQNAITDAQIVRARNILQFYLTNVPNSQYGNDKTAVMNAMGTNEAMLLLLNGSDNGNPPAINGQPLYQNEMAVEGHTWYQTNDYDNHRDASFEEILHLMHDYGIGVDQNGTPSPFGALPAYQAEIRAAQDNADNSFAKWPLGAATDPGIMSWYNELSNENSLSQEYLAAVIDSYYGLWGAWTENAYGMYGMYIAKTRAGIQMHDSLAWALLPKYFSPYININMDIDSSFTGTFSMAFDAAQPYTHKAQYLQHCTLTGSNAANLKGNDLYNRLNGNGANNELEGGKGNDRLNGHGGTDVAKFTGNAADYTISYQGGLTIVADHIANRDAVDTLWGVENMQFADQLIATNIRYIPAENAFKVYPNPVTTVATVEWEAALFQEGTIEIINSLGQVVWTEKMAGGINKMQVEVENLAAGWYSIQLIDKNNVSTIPILFK